MDTLPADVRDIMAVGHTSVVVDEFNNINTFGCNKQGQLGDNSEEECRSDPGKLGREFILDQIVMLRGHYEEASPLVDPDATSMSAAQNVPDYLYQNYYPRAAAGSWAAGQSAHQKSKATLHPS